MPGRTTEIGVICRLPTIHHNHTVGTQRLPVIQVAIGAKLFDRGQQALQFPVVGVIEPRVLLRIVLLKTGIGKQVLVRRGVLGQRHIVEPGGPRLLPVFQHHQRRPGRPIGSWMELPNAGSPYLCLCGTSTG